MVNQLPSQEVSLEDLDKMLDVEDPDFNKGLDEVRVVEADPNVVIEASVTEENLGTEVQGADSEIDGERGPRRLLVRFKFWRASLRDRIKERIKAFFKASQVFLKTAPKDFFFYALKTMKVLGKQAAIPVTGFLRASRAQKILIVTLLALCAGCVALVIANVRGIWLPQLNPPDLRDFSRVADWVDTYDPKDPLEDFYGAFPQERHEFLFNKFKINLRASGEHPDPMGAFEIIVLLDSKDTAIEVADRKVELFDAIQRILEDESFPAMESELGKERVKSKIKKELNGHLTQGWAKDVNFKTFILKP